MEIIFSTPKNHYQIHMDDLEISDLCAMLQTRGRIAFTRRVELGDADDMELMIDGDSTSDMIFLSVNGANMSVESTREEMRLKIIASANARTDVMFDALDVDFEV